MEFEWDTAKDARTMQERGFGFDDATRIFSGRVVTWEDDRRDYGEQRFRAVGETEGDILHVVYTWRGDVMRIISLRRANRKEIRRWRS
jgi:uncharacterized DUF497 family protein